MVPYTVEYHDGVMEYLEHIGYPFYVMDYEPESVAKSISSALIQFSLLNISIRMAAILIFSMTMTERILPDLESATKH